jgi:hypothetical protein
MTGPRVFLTQAIFQSLEQNPHRYQICSTLHILSFEIENSSPRRNKHFEIHHHFRPRSLALARIFRQSDKNHRALGYRCVTVSMPIVGSTPPVTSLDEDIAIVRAAGHKGTGYRPGRYGECPLVGEGSPPPALLTGSVKQRGSRKGKPAQWPSSLLSHHSYFPRVPAWKKLLAVQRTFG